MFVWRKSISWLTIYNLQKFVKSCMLKNFLKLRRNSFIFINNNFLKNWLSWASSFFVCINKRNFWKSRVINWFKRVQKFSKKNCMFWKKNRISSFLQAIFLLICWFLKSMWILFFSHCLTISEWILALKKVS